MHDNIRTGELKIIRIPESVSVVVSLVLHHTLSTITSNTNTFQRGAVSELRPEVTALGPRPPLRVVLSYFRNIHSLPIQVAGVNVMLYSKPKNSVSLKKSLQEKVQIISDLR